MEVKNDLNIIGIATVTVRDARGRFVCRTVQRNKINNYARKAYSQWVTGAAANTLGGALPYPRKIALGTGTGTITGNEVALFNETAGTRKATSYQRQTQDYYAEWNVNYTTSDPTGNFTEAGLFDELGKLWAQVLLTNANKQTGQTLTVNWKWLHQGN